MGTTSTTTTSTTTTTTTTTITGAPTPGPGGWAPYTKLEDTWCPRAVRYVPQNAPINSLEAARGACQIDEDCVAIYNDECGDCSNCFELCSYADITIFADSVKDSCTYPKISLAPGHRPNQPKAVNRFLSHFMEG